MTDININDFMAAYEQPNIDVFQEFCTKNNLIVDDVTKLVEIAYGNEFLERMNNMLTKEELTKRLERDDELYTRLTNERKTVYQRMRRYRNMLYHITKIEQEVTDNFCD